MRLALATLTTFGALSLLTACGGGGSAPATSTGGSGTGGTTSTVQGVTTPSSVAVVTAR